MVTNETAEFRVPLPYNNKMGSAEQQGLEFDGTAVLCRVCGDKASGFHYGVHSCEGCKGFFRRSIQQKIQYRPCSKNQQCSVGRVNRNRCQYCRLKKCISVGMSRDAVRFGRVPKREKARIMAAMEASHLNKTSKLNLNDESTSVNDLKSTIINAHFKTCEFTKNKIEGLIKPDTQVENVKVEDIAKSLTCPLYPTRQSSVEENLNECFADRFTTAVRGVVEFAKLLPGFNTVSQEDQVILLKNAVFEVLLLRLSNMFMHDRMICINGKIINITNIEEEINMESSNAVFMIQSMLKFFQSLNEWALNDNIIAIFSSMVLMSWDRPGLTNPEMIKNIQARYRLVLQTLLPVDLCNTLESKITDLRTLSALHSEKLLSFGLDDNMNMNMNCKSEKYYPINRFGEGDTVCANNNVEMDTTDQFPYNNINTSALTQFPVSPSSNDSGVESGACSSPSRSEISETMSNVDESFLYIRRTLQAPHYMEEEKSDSSECEDYTAIGHKKFRRRTLSPPMGDRGQMRQSVIASPPPCHYEHVILSSKQEYEDADQIYNKNKTPLQLFPQLASALTRPAPATGPIVHYINVEEMNMRTLKQSLLNPPVSFNAGQSDYLHRLIMKHELTDENKIPMDDQNEAPLNLCIKKPRRMNGLGTT